MNNVKSVSKAVIPVVGLGAHMLPATKAVPKKLLLIYDRLLIEHAFKEVLNGGIREIIFFNSKWKEAIENHFDTHYELEHRSVKK